MKGGALDFITSNISGQTGIQIARLSESAGLPTAGDVVGLINDPLLRPQALRLVSDGTSSDYRDFAQRFDFNRNEITDALNMAEIRRSFRSGATLIVEDVGKWHSPVARICNFIFNEFWNYSNAGYFITGAGKKGLPFHADEETSFVFQLSGSKRWQVVQTIADKSGPSAFDDAAGIQEFDLLPGDAACIPPFHPHRTESLGAEDSVHLTVGVRQFKVKDLLRASFLAQSRVESLETKLSSLGRAHQEFSEAIGAIGTDEWAKHLAIASIRIASGGLAGGFELRSAAPQLPRTGRGFDDLMWKVGLGERFLVFFGGTHAILDRAGVDSLSAIAKSHAVGGVSWRDLAADRTDSPGVRRLLEASGWAVASEAGQQ